MNQPMWTDIVDKEGTTGKPKRLWFPRIRAWLPVLGIVFGVLGVAFALVWFLLLPEYRPGLRDGEQYGVDVSAHQGEVHWDKVADDNIGFAYIKVSEGASMVDERFAANWKAAKAAGVDRGAYHFFTLCRPGSDQAKHFLETLGPDVGELSAAVDLELAGNCSERPTNAEVQKELGAFIAAVEYGTGRPALLYVGDDFEDRYPVRAELDRPLWHRRWLTHPGIDGWLVWQVTSRAHVKGIDGWVDLDVKRPSSNR